MSKLETTLQLKREEQWVYRVIGYSSQYNNESWSANQVIGPPKVYPRHGDIVGTWAQGIRSHDEYIIVEFKQAVYPERIDIYETFNPGAIVKVLARNGKDNVDWETVWETEAPHTERQSRIFSVSCKNMEKREINQIRLNINCTSANTWCEIDCIKLVGYASNMSLLYKEIITDLKDLLINDYSSDVIFQLESRQLIPSYRNILSIRCIYFEELFNEYPPNRAEPIPIKNISYNAFYQILHFIFTDTIELNLTYDVCLELMYKADEYFLARIYQQAFEILKKTINKTNALKILMQSGFFSAASNTELDDTILLNDVADLCVEFIKKNLRDIYRHENMQPLSKHMLLKLGQLLQ